MDKKVTIIFVDHVGPFPNDASPTLLRSRLFADKPSSFSTALQALDGPRRACRRYLCSNRILSAIRRRPFTPRRETNCLLAGRVHFVPLLSGSLAVVVYHLGSDIVRVAKARGSTRTAVGTALTTPSARPVTVVWAWAGATVVGNGFADDFQLDLHIGLNGFSPFTSP